ncbi:hypothetical protein BV898_18992 [Hypsibius exemplaris]|uniref:MULE transposase domain-containing protein n=1 Tax=Hypsibius exemplaris TaxID=2072580 RepID=A0A9X6RP22_HYPEX|nr:hypothetical protein BV898_18992 [Hypsibius exemplaris]
MRLMASWKDVLSDDHGSWVQTTGGRTTHALLEDGECHLITDEQYRHAPNAVSFKRVYWKHPTFPYRRNLLRCVDGRCQFAIMQYQYDGNPDDCDWGVPIHSNRKHGSRPYSRTMQSVKNNIKESGRAAALTTYQGNRKDILRLGHPSSIASGKKQIMNLNQPQQTGENIAGVMEKCREELHFPEIRFIRIAMNSPRLLVFLATKQQLADLEIHCCNPDLFSVLGIDTTFNCGKFYVTVFTFRHLMLKSKYNRVRDINPVMIRAIFIHGDRSKETYTDMILALIAACPALEDRLNVFGTDSDESLYGPCREYFKRAEHLLCSLHVRDNIDRKLSSLGVPKRVRDEIAADIDGKQVDGVKQGGLVDRLQDEYHDAVDRLCGVWSDLIGAKGPVFVQYFLAEKSDKI